jgi:hypothetical protein
VRYKYKEDKNMRGKNNGTGNPKNFFVGLVSGPMSNMREQCGKQNNVNEKHGKENKN